MMRATLTPNLSGVLAPDAEENSRIPADETLVLRIREGDSSAAEALIRRYRQKAFAIASTLCDGDREAALDYTQEAFLKVLGNIGSFRGKSSFYTWFYRILVNTCLDGRRKRKRWERLFPGRRSASCREDGPEPAIEGFPSEDNAGDPLAAACGSALAQDLATALDDLTEKQRTVFQLKVFQGLSLAEIARMMGSAQGTVKTHLFRATRALREALSEWGEDKGVKR